LPQHINVRYSISSWLAVAKSWMYHATSTKRSDPRAAGYLHSDEGGLLDRGSFLSAVENGGQKEICRSKRWWSGTAN
jgi:hypothetical protein